jgi:hypothetical protein
VVLPYYLCHVEKHVCLFHDGDRCGMVGSDKDRGRSRRLGAEDRGWSSTGRILGGQTIESSGDAVCYGLFVVPQN